MNTIKIMSFVVLLLLMTATASAERLIVKTELVESEHGSLGDIFGWGYRVYETTYDDGYTTYTYKVGNSLTKGEIIYVQPRIEVPKGGDPSGNIAIPITLQGVRCSFSPGIHEHKLRLAYVVGTTKEYITTKSQPVGCDVILDTAFTVENSGFGSRINNVGEYHMIVEENVAAGTYNTLIYGNKLLWLKVSDTGTTTSPIISPTPYVSNPTTGTISVSSNPSGASVYIQSGYEGTTPINIQRPAGNYIVDVKLSGYNIYTSGVSVSVGGTSTVNAQLTSSSIPTPAPTPKPTTYAGNGNINVQSNIQGNVYIDNTFVGLTGNTFSTEVGGHDIKVIKDGYSDYRTRVIVDYGQTSNVNAQLTQIYIPTPTPTPTPFTSTTSVSTPTQTSGMTLETPTTTRTPSPAQTPYDTPGFEAVFAIAGLLVVAYLVLRQKEPGEPLDDMD